MTEGIEYLGRARVQGIALLVVAFLVGVLAGAAGDRALARRHAWHPGPPGGPRPHGLPPMLDNLELTEAQRTSIDSLFQSYRPRTEAAMRETMPRLRAVADSLHAAIREVLTPEQRTRFDRDLKSRRTEGFGLPLPAGGPPPPHGPPPHDGPPPHGGPPPPGGPRPPGGPPPPPGGGR
jgi:Spy/CpxP family protein refolding chaperone